MNFKDKVVVVTGSAQGIGRAAAEAFAREGASVIVNDVDETRLNQTAYELRAFEVPCLPVVADTSDQSQVRGMFDRVVHEFGRVDALVNNAGITRDALLHKMTSEQWKKVIDVNLTGVFYCLQAAANVMRQAGRGAIVNISSASRFGNVGQANYSASKAGVVGLTRTAAKELARSGVRVNAISPGPIDTDMLRAVPAKTLEKLLAFIPLGRAGTVNEICELILFLSSDRSSYITGQVINCDGGWFMC